MSTIVSFLESLFSPNGSLRQWTSVDFAAQPVWAIFITFFVVFGLRNQLLSRWLSAAILVVILALFTGGMVLNRDDSNLLNCQLIPAGNTKIGARAATVNRLGKCNQGMFGELDLTGNWEPKLNEYSHLILRSDDSLNGYLRETERWQLVTSSNSERTFVRGFGDFDLRFDLFERTDRSAPSSS